MVGIDRHVRVDQINFQATSSLAGVSQSLGQWIARQQALRLELLVDPCEELLDDRLGVHQSIVEFPGRAELLLADIIAFSRSRVRLRILRAWNASLMFR